MPNWCSNSIRIEGDAKALAEVLTELPDFSLGRVTPMPEELANIGVGSMKIDGVMVRHWRNVVVDGVEKAVALSPEEELGLLAKYGVLDWYSWGLQNFGTKWDIQPEPWNVEEGALWVDFDTAWSPPTPVVEKLSERFPQVRVIHSYSEGGFDFAGSDTYVAGLLIEEVDITPSAHTTYDEETGETTFDAEFASFLANNNLWIGG